MARSGKGARAGLVAGSLLGVLISAALASAQNATPVVPSPYSPECREGTTPVVLASPLPNVAAALERRKTIRILAIGASAGRRGRGSYTEQIERLLEQALKGINVVMINRGVSGELAADARNRIRIEVALSEPDLVLWQVGTNDALSYIPLNEIEEAVVDAIRWLKENKVDVVLAGLQYVDRMAQDEHYRAVRHLLRKIAAQENVIIVRRYEAMELIAQAGRPGGDFAPDEFERTEAGYSCLAQYFARAVTLGVFGRGMKDIGPLRERPR